MVTMFLGEDTTRWDAERSAAMKQQLEGRLVQAFGSSAKGVVASGDFASMPGVMNGGEWLRQMTDQGKIVISDSRTWGVLTDSQEPDWWVGMKFAAFDPASASDMVAMEAILTGANDDMVGFRILAEPETHAQPGPDGDPSDQKDPGADGGLPDTADRQPEQNGDQGSPARKRWPWIVGGIVAIGGIATVVALTSKGRR